MDSASDTVFYNGKAENIYILRLAEQEYFYVFWNLIRHNFWNIFVWSAWVYVPFI